MLTTLGAYILGACFLATAAWCCTGERRCFNVTSRLSKCGCLLAIYMSNLVDMLAKNNGHRNALMNFEAAGARLFTMRLLVCAVAAWTS